MSKSSKLDSHADANEQPQLDLQIGFNFFQGEPFRFGHDAEYENKRRYCNHPESREEDPSSNQILHHNTERTVK